MITTFRRFLLGCCIFFLKALEAPKHSNAPSGTRTSSSLVMQFNMMTRIDLNELKIEESIFNDGDEYAEYQLQELVYLHTSLPKRKVDMNERTTSLVPIHIFTHITNILSVSGIDVQLVLEERPKNIIHNGFVPDCSFVDSENRVLIYCEIKRYPLFTGDIFNNEARTFNSRLKGPMKQLAYEMIMGKCAFGILADCSVAIFLEIDLEAAKAQEENLESNIPMRYLLTGEDYIKPSYLQVLLKWIIRASEKRKETTEAMETIDWKDIPNAVQAFSGENQEPRGEGDEESRDEGNEEPRDDRGGRPSDTGPSDGADSGAKGDKLEEGVSELQEMASSSPRGDYRYDYVSSDSVPSSDNLFSLDPNQARPSSQLEGRVTKVCLNAENVSYIKHGYDTGYQVFKTAARNLGSSLILEAVDPDEMIVGKIFEAKISERYWSYHLQYLTLKVNSSYEMERKCIQKLSRDQEFNNCYINHGPLDIELKDPHLGLVKGKCILSRYIRSELVTQREIYDKAKRQLDIIHRNEIIHNDVADRNILYQGGKVYFIDFGEAKISQSQKLREQDHDRLKEEFAIVKS